MVTISIHEQIAMLRRRKGMTQEELARALGVTNQAVSKWESAQCCPDIQLLPEMARLFGVTVDELLGTATSKKCMQPGNMIPALCDFADTLSKEEYIPVALRMARALHAILLDKEIADLPEPHPAWNSRKDEIIREAATGQWYFTAWTESDVTTIMRRGTVLFSDNQSIAQADTRRISAILRPFSDARTLKIAFALYELTVGHEKATASLDDISHAAALSADVVSESLAGALASFIHEDSHGGFRFDNEQMQLMPLLFLFDQR